MAQIVAACYSQPMGNSSFHGAISQRAIDYVDKIRDPVEANVVLSMFGAWLCRTHFGKFEPIDPETYFDHYVAYRSAIAAFQEAHEAGDLWSSCATGQQVMNVERAFAELVQKTPAELRVLAYRYLWFVVAVAGESLDPQDLYYHLLIFNFAFGNGGIERIRTDKIITRTDSLVDFDTFALNYW